jgi:hypothetical protein
MLKPQQTGAVWAARVAANQLQARPPTLAAAAALPALQQLQPLCLCSVTQHAGLVFTKTTVATTAAAAARVYRSSRKLYHEADSQGMRVYHDELIMGDVRMVMLGR